MSAGFSIAQREGRFYAKFLEDASAKEGVFLNSFLYSL
jgi:hypothetical protein